MKKASFVAIVFTVAAFVAQLGSGAGGNPPAPPATDKGSFTVMIDNFMLSPQDLQVPVGATVTWINKDEEPHTVVEINRAFVSEALDTDGRFTHKFTAAGKYSFFCTLHPRMTGTITVDAK